MMAVMDFTRGGAEDDIRQEIDRLVAAGRLRQEETKVLNVRKLAAFFQSGLGRAMVSAYEKGVLHREQPFVMGRRASEIFEDRKENDMVLVQGIIDGYYEGEDGIVLMDYKTDSLRQGQESVLADRYRTQMILYREALEAMTGKKVTRCVLYSFSLEKEIDL
jgi:ATP-dependent helicase/nuclease subunit A